jgi:hypothetical protein
VFESGALYDPKVLDIKDEDLLSQVSSAIAQVAAVSLELHYPTLASVPHSIINGYKNVLAVAVETDYSFELADKVRSNTPPPPLFLLLSLLSVARQGIKFCGQRGGSSGFLGYQSALWILIGSFDRAPNLLRSVLECTCWCVLVLWSGVESS